MEEKIMGKIMERSIVLTPQVLSLLDDNPRDLLVFIFLLRKADENGEVKFTLIEIQNKFAISQKQVRNSIAILCKGNLLGNLRANKGQFGGQIADVLNFAEYQSLTKARKTGGANTRANKGQIKGNLEGSLNEAEKEGVEVVSEQTYYERVQEIWNNICPPDLPPVKQLSDKRKEHIRARLKEFSGTQPMREPFSVFEEICRRMKASPFLSGKTSKWKASFDWVISSPNNWIKIIEGNYDERDHLTDREYNERLERFHRGQQYAEAIEQERGGVPF